MPAVRTSGRALRHQLATRAGNYLQAILAALHDVEPKAEQMQAGSVKDMA